MKHRAKKALRLGTLATVLLVSLAAAGQQPATYPECTRKPTAADVDGAKGAHKAATQFYDRGDYDRAIQYWRDAYSFDCTAHAVLINIANAYEKKGDKPAAISTLETFLARDPRSPEASTVSEKLNNLKSQVQQQQAATQPTAPAPTAPPPDTTQPTTTAAPSPPPATGARPFGPAPWIVVGVGGAVLIAGVILVPVGAGKVSDAENSCPTHKNCASDVASQGNSGRTLQRLGIVGLAVGGAAIAGGLIWQLAFNKPRRAPDGNPAARLRLGPWLAPTVAGASVDAAF